MNNFLYFELPENNQHFLRTVLLYLVTKVIILFIDVVFPLLTNTFKFTFVNGIIKIPDVGVDRESSHRIPRDLRGDRTLVCRGQATAGGTRQVTVVCGYTAYYRIL